MRTVSWSMFSWKHPRAVSLHLTVFAVFQRFTHLQSSAESMSSCEHCSIGTSSYTSNSFMLFISFCIPSMTSSSGNIGSVLSSWGSFSLIRLFLFCVFVYCDGNFSSVFQSDRENSDCSNSESFVIRKQVFRKFLIFSSSFFVSNSRFRWKSRFSFSRLKRFKSQVVLRFSDSFMSPLGID